MEPLWFLLLCGLLPASRWQACALSAGVASPTALDRPSYQYPTSSTLVEKTATSRATKSPGLPRPAWARSANGDVKQKFPTINSPGSSPTLITGDSHPIVGRNVTGNSGYRTVAYFVNWATYGRNYQPQNLPADKLTHVLYAFADIIPETGEVILSDQYADVEKHFSNDSWQDVGNNVYGCVKQLFLLKKQNRRLKTLLSIGGWTYSEKFSIPASTEQGRQRFADSAVKLLADLGFDGLDIDWEYPEAGTEAQNYVLLLRAIREALDRYSQSLQQNPHLLLTVASPCGSDHYQSLALADMDGYVDFWNLMAYDLTVGLGGVAAHQTNLLFSQQNNKSTPFSVETAIQYYTESAGIAKSKIVLGMPLYGRIFANTDGPGTPFQGSGNEYSWESGIWDYKALPRQGATEYHDDTAQAAWSYNEVDRTMVSYDTPANALDKASYIAEEQLGGAMWWESSGDKTDENSLIHLVSEALSSQVGGQLDQSQNTLEYPGSKYQNLKDKFPDN